jgi:hypothetical protein
MPARRPNDKLPLSRGIHRGWPGQAGEDVLRASGTAERDAAVEMAKRVDGKKRVTVGAGKGYDKRGFDS